MADRLDWGLRLLLAGLGLGMSLLLFAVTCASTAFYQDWVAPTMTGAMRPLGYALDGGILLAFAMTVAGIGCFSFGTTPTPAAVAAGTLQRTVPAASHRGANRRVVKRPRPGAPQGST